MVAKLLFIFYQRQAAVKLDNKKNVIKPYFVMKSVKAIKRNLLAEGRGSWKIVSLQCFIETCML